MTEQFDLKRFARGVRLTTAHVYDPLTDIKAAALASEVEHTTESTGVFRSTWVLPWAGPEAAQADMPIALWPFVMPPFQELFDNATLQDPGYTVLLNELSLSFDQHSEPIGVVGDPSFSSAGLLTACDMSRYDMTLRLMERTPSYLSGDTRSANELLRVDIAGVEAFGNEYRRSNPLVVSDLSIRIKPFAVYFWELSCPGLYKTAGAGVHGEWRHQVGGAYAAGDTCRRTVAGNNYDYVVLLGDTDADVAAGSAAASAADPDYDVTSNGDLVISTIKLPEVNPAAVPIATSFLAGAGTYVSFFGPTASTARTVEQLALVSLTLSAVFQAPLTTRDANLSDIDDPDVQNLPTRHNGISNGTTITMPVPPAGNAIIDGGTDIQAAMHPFDQELRERAESGYGAGSGAFANPVEAIDVPTASLLKNDSHYMMIVVPLWSGQKRTSIRGLDIATAGMPYLTAPDYKELTIDSRVWRVPQNFVLHHVFAAWSNYSPPSGWTGQVLQHEDYGTRSTSVNYDQKVTVSLNSCAFADDYKQQMVAHLPFDGATADNYLLDQYDADANGHPGYSLLCVPIVGPDGVFVNPRAWNLTCTNGKPFFMGAGSFTTKDRTYTCPLPAGFGSGGYVEPVTLGRENLIEVRWTKENALGLDAVADDVICGQGGDFVILCGKTTLSA